jgi:hypothetical protein
MEIAFGILVVVFSLLAWGGQAVTWLAPTTAAKLSLTEAEGTVEPVYSADVRGEAAWDTLVLWTMLVAGVLLIADHAAWARFGLVGGGMYVYFAGRGVAARIVMQQRGYRIGAAQNVTLGYVLLVLWGILGLMTIGVAAASLGSA